MKYIMYLSLFCLGFVFNAHASDGKKKLAVKVQPIAVSFVILTDLVDDQAVGDATGKEFKSHKRSSSLTPKSKEYISRFAVSPKSDALQIPATSGAKKKKSSRAERERKHKLSDEKEHKDKLEHKSDDSDSPTSSDNEPDQK